MKAEISSITDVDVVLTIAEIRDLGTKKISGTARLIGNNREVVGSRILEIVVGEMKSNLFLELESHPYGVSYEEITGYILIVSNEGYEMLNSKGVTIDRISGGAKLTLESESYRRKF